MSCKYEPVSKQDKGWEEKRKGEKRIEKNQKSDIVDKKNYQGRLNIIINHNRCKR